MKHPWNDKSPLSAWYPGGYSEMKDPKVSRTIRPVFDNSKCIKCNMCYIYCPDGCIIRDDKYSVNYIYCRGCGVCAKECPRGAISMIREDKV